MTTTCASTSARKRATALIASLALGAGLLLAGCGDDDTTETTDTTEGTSGQTTEAPSDTTGGSTIEVTDAWARSSPAVADAGAAYMVLTNPGDVDDALVSASVADTVAATVELHETRAAGGMGGGGMGDTSTTTPMMEMVPVDRIDVPAGESVSLEPGGLHIMLLGLVEPLAVGDELELTLTFEVAGDVVVTVVVGDGAP
jgi:copper(I)-binding protein